MINEQFFKIIQWLKLKSKVTFQLETPFLGRPGDNQFELLKVEKVFDHIEIQLSDNLNIKIKNPADFVIFENSITISEIENLIIHWEKKSIEIKSTWLLIET